MNRGLWSAVGACVGWGLFPVFWKQLGHVPGLELIAHRFVWSFALLALILIGRGHVTAWGRTLTRRPRHALVVLTGLLIGTNWFTFLWAVESDLIVEASLGYFISPLVNVALGVIVLREHLRPIQWVAIALAVSGVLYLTLVYGSLPTLALVLALSFGAYGLLKKSMPLSATYGLAAETGALFVPAIVYLVYVEQTGTGTFLREGTASDALLMSTGLVTVGPLLLFNWAVQRIPLSLMGILQYIAPVLQFTLGIALYHEPFTVDQLVGFSLVWVSLLLFTLERLLVPRPVTTSALAE